ncbi:MAG: histidine phosphatase family protein [Candidatus Staskawiczbacteria bacterium]|nr:histidine phosphatase family protein [Candidatus Staskawiczbacteria bacterium]
MRLIIARHGQTNENVSGIIIGQEANAMLNKEGILQAQKLAEFLKNEKINFAYVSSQTRAVHTAKEVLKFHPTAQVVVAHQLKEQNLGIYEGKGKTEWKEIKKNSKEPFHVFKPQNGESYAELQERVKTFFGDLIPKHKNDTVLMVSHGGNKAHKPENTALTVLDIFTDKEIKIHYFNSTEHLKNN